MEGNKPLSIFDVKPENYASFQKPDWGNRTEFFDPKPDEASDKVYRAVIRILPNLTNPAIPVAIVKYYWFGDGRNGFRYNTPSTPNMHPQNPEDMAKPIGWCPVSELYWNFRRSGDARLEQIATERFSMQSQYICFVQVKQDQVHPENNGKILPYRLPAAIFKRIQDAMNPSQQDIAMGTQPVEVFHPVKGRDILLKISLKNVNGTMMRDYEVCKIADTPSSLFINGAGCDINRYDTDEAYRSNVIAKITEMLKEVPEVEKTYGYEEASNEVKAKVKAILAEYTDVTNIWPGIQMHSPVAAAPAAAPSPAPAPSTQPAQTAVDPFAAAGQQQPAPAAAPSPAPAPDPFAGPSQQATQDFVKSLQGGQPAPASAPAPATEPFA